MRRFASALFILLSSMVTIPAQSPIDDAFIAPGFEMRYATSAWLPAADTVEAVVGAGWVVNRDPMFGTPRWIIGPGYDAAARTREGAVTFARDLARRLAVPLGIDTRADLTLMGTAETPGPTGHRIFGVDFKQTLDGYDVRTLTEHRRVVFRFDLTVGLLSAFGSGWIAGLEVDPRRAMGREAAQATAHRYIPRYAPGLGRVAGFDTYVLVGCDGESGAIARLVHEVRIQAEGATANDWRVILDAVTGERLYVADETLACGGRADVVGNVAAGSLDAQGGTPPAVQFSVKPVRSATVSIIGGGSSTTDAQGNFRIAHNGGTVVTIAGRFSGDWCVITNNAFPDTSFSMAATPGTPANVLLNPTHQTEFATAEATAYHWTTATHDFIAKRIPGFNGLARQPTHVNDPPCCNAWWNTSRIRYCRSGNGCINSAISEVCGHEFGHGFHYWFHGSISPGGFSEGIGDHLGAYLTAQRRIGRNIRGPGTEWRDYRAGGGACCTQWPPNNRRVHKVGEIWCGAMMDLRDLLILKHGAQTGVDIAESITIPQYTRNPTDMPDAALEIFLQDDNDADLTNGTPNFVEIAKALDQHSIPRPADPLVVTIAHTGLPTSRDVVNGYPVIATIRSPQAPITQAFVDYRIGAGPSVRVNMTAGQGGVYAMTIPAQPALTTITYSITGTDANNNTTRWPSNGSFSFKVGHEVIAFADDFETYRGWTPAGDDNASTGRFERADPVSAWYNGQQAQPEDDHTPGAGRICYVTQNGQRGQDASLHDVDNGKTTIISPQFDLRGAPTGAATLEFAYWFSLLSQQNDVFRVDLSRDGGNSWNTLTFATTPVVPWKVVKDLALPGPYTSTMHVRFWLADTPNNSVVDALVDDVKIGWIDDNVAALRAQTKTPSPGTFLQYSLDAPREPNAPFLYAIALSTGPTPISGIGVSGLGTPLFALVFGALDGNGRTAFQVPIPNHPAMRGLRVQTEALVAGNAFVFSNLWTVDIQ